MLMSELLRVYLLHACSLFSCVRACIVCCVVFIQHGRRNTHADVHASRTYCDFDILSGTELNVKIWLPVLAICKGHIHIAQTFRSDKKRSWKKKIITHYTSHTSVRLFIHAYEFVGSIYPTHDHQPFLFLLQPCNYKGVVGLPCLLFCFFM